MVTNLYFVRHAHSAYTPDDLNRPLSQQGFADAVKVTQTLEKENIVKVISSPYKRAFQTVEGIANQAGLKVEIEDNLKERKLTSKPVEDFTFAITKLWENPAFSWEGGESNMAAQKRGMNAVIRILKQYEGKNIVIGTHGNIMALIMNYFDNTYDFQFWKQLEMPDIYKLTFEKNIFKQAARIKK